MDPQPDAGVLSRRRPAGTRLAALLLVTAACGDQPLPPPTPLPALAGPASLLRLPRAGGQVVAHATDDLQPAGWTSNGRLSPLRQPLGADLDERLIFAVDTGGNLVALDLETRAVRGNLLSGVAAATLAGDGSIYTVDRAGRVTHLLRRMPTRYRAPLPAPPSALVGALNDRLVAITAGASPAVVVLGADSEVEPFEVPDGEVAATLWGDLLAIAADTVVFLYDTQRREPRPALRAGGGARAVAFSPSGHRIYVARARAELLVFDRFSLERVAAIPLPSPVSAVRTDASGRWILLRTEGADSIDVVDATVNRAVARLGGGWASDLPLVAGAATLVLRSGEAIEAWDLTNHPPSRTGTVNGGARDFWTLIAWVPPARAAELAERPDSAAAVQDSAIVFGAIPPPVLREPSRVYLQVSSSRNVEWARELARQLAGSGYPASVREPQTADEGYRVLLGPYPNREAAEEAGRRLGRPFFVLTDPGPPGPR